MNRKGNFMRMPAVFAALVLLLALGAEAMAAADVRSVRVWRAPDNTRLVFDLSGPVEHSVFTLSAPERLVIDVQGAQLSAALESLSFENTPIKALRSAQRSASELRMVIDLSKAISAKSFSLPPNQQYGHRLVVDLYDQGASAASPPVAESPAAAGQSVVKLAPIASGKRDILIAIDSGHGGEDPGAVGPRGVKEKDVVLAIAKELQRLINAEKGYKAQLVRTGDYFIALRKRTEIARKMGADLFISVHADAAPRTAAFGASVFALSDRGATSETARWLADSENRSDLIGGDGGVSLDDKNAMLAGVLLDLSMTATLSSSLDVGQKVLGHMGRITPLHKNRVEQAGFMVLKSPDIPSILVETGFISNPAEAAKLQTKRHQQALASSIHSGLRQYFQQNPPPGTYLAWLRDSKQVEQLAQTAKAPRTHVVSAGENLLKISQRYGVSLASLRSANRLAGDNIQVGQSLTIPTTTLAIQP